MARTGPHGGCVIWWIVAAALGLGVALGPGERPREAGAVKWAEPGAPGRIRAMAKRVERQTNWLGLADFLTAVAYWESRGDSNAIGSAGEVGWFQIGSGSRCLEQLGIQQSDLRGNEWLQVVVAACHAQVLGTLYTDFVPDWLAIRRGWKYPRLTGDVHERDPVSADIRRRFAEALRRVGSSTAFMSRQVFPGDFHWPGVQQIAEVS